MRNRSVAAAAAVGTLALIGCFTVHFDFDTNVDGTVSFALGHLDGDCIDQDPSDAVIQTLVGDKCHIEVSWAGTLIDMNAVRAAIEPDLDGHSLDEVDLDFESAVMTFHDIALTDGAGQRVEPPPTVESWSGQLSLAGNPLVDFSGENTADLLDAVVSVEVGSDDVDLIEQSFADATPVPGTGAADFTIDMASLAALAGRDDLQVSFDFEIAFAGTGGADAL